MTVLGDSDSKSRSEEKTKEVILLVIREMKSKEIERIYQIYQIYLSNQIDSFIYRKNISIFDKKYIERILKYDPLTYINIYTLSYN